MKLGNNVRYFNKYFFCALVIFVSIIIQSLTPLIAKAATTTFAVSGSVIFNIPKADGESSYGPISLVLIPHGSPQAESYGKIATTETEKVTPKKDSISVKISYTFKDVPTPDFYLATLNVCINNSSNIKTTICSEPVTYSKDTLKYNKVNLTLTDEEATASQNAGTIPGLNADGSSGKSSCALNGIGWILCPVMNFMAGVVDLAYSQVSELLMLPSLNIDITKDDNYMYSAWQIMRSIANVGFVIAFMVIIFSQITSIGISNYGIKKMLPKLVVAAILVNISYFVCALAIDVSNIAGNSLKGVFESVAGKIEAPIINGSSGWIAITAAVLSVGRVAIFSSITILLPALVTVLFAIWTALLVLTLRQALIVLLVVISPLAFVMYLLPNTEKWFTKWRETFTTLLLMFPIISVIFGASALASKIVMKSGESSGSFALQTMGAAMSIIPLAITPLIMKTAGGLLNKIGAVINNPNRGPFDKLRKAAEGAHERSVNKLNNKAMNLGDDSTFGQRLRFGGRRAYLRHKARNNAIDQNQKRETARTEAEYIAQETRGDNLSATQQALSKATGGIYSGKGLRTQMTTGGSSGAQNRAWANAETNLAKLDADEVSAASLNLDAMRFNGKSLTQDQMMQIATGKDVTDDRGVAIPEAGASMFDMHTRRAAIQRAAKIATVGQAQELVDASSGMDVVERKTLVNSLAGSSVLNKASYLSGKTLGDIENGTATVEKAVIEALMAGKINAEVLSKTDKQSAKKIFEIAKANAGTLSSISVTMPDGTVKNIDAIQTLKDESKKVFAPGSRLQEGIASNSEHEAYLKAIDTI